VNSYKPDIKVIDERVQNGKLTGHFWCADDNGLPKVETTFRDGEIDGEYRSVWNPKTKSWDWMDHYRAGKRDGVSKRRNPSGNWVISYYQDDKEHGVEIVVDSSGKMLTDLGNCEVHGKRSPMSECADIYIPGYEKAMQAYADQQGAAKKAAANRVIEHRWGNGKISTHYQIVNGKIEGKMEEFFQDGKPSFSTMYVHGKKNGDEKEYFEGGQLKRVTSYKDDTPVSEVTYFQNGKKNNEWVITQPGFPVSTRSVKSYYDNGQLQAQGTQVGDNWDGDYQSFDDSGDPLSMGKYDHGNQIGTWHTFSKTLQAEFDDEYDKGVLMKRSTYKDKKLVRRQEFMPDGSTKSDQSFPGTSSKPNPSL
jgi:antitoxin component YwqK of YwqJK toxin-antitoxin module